MHTTITPPSNPHLKAQKNLPSPEYGNDLKPHVLNLVPGPPLSVPILQINRRRRHRCIQARELKSP